MIIGNRLRSIREGKNMSQADIEKHTGLLRCYVSRVENGHTVPGIDTLEKWAKALQVPMYQLFCDRTEPPNPLNVPFPVNGNGAWGTSGKQLILLNKFRRALGHMDDHQRKLLLTMASRISMSRAKRMMK